jgi:hypothetical protein
MKYITTPLLTLAIVGQLLTSYAFSQNEPLDTINDGPYIFSDPKSLTAKWLCQGKLETQKILLSQLPIILNECQLSANIESISPLPQSLIHQGDFRVAALSDFHGQYDLMMTLLTNNKVIDNQGDWHFGNGHFVITGDVFDRGDKVTEILWFLYHLERQAEQAGGKVHLLLGNHEVMVLNGDLRYLHPKYIEVAKKLALPFEQLFAKKTVLGDWLRSKSVLVKVNDMLFAHGGFHPSLAREKRTLADINSVFKNNLVKAEMATERQGWGKYLHKSNGPVWYRGYFAKERGKDDGASSEEIDLLLSHFNIKHLIVGHTSQKQIETRYQGRVIAIDSSIKRGEYGEILFIDGSGAVNQHGKEHTSKKWRGSLSGKVLPLD